MTNDIFNVGDEVVVKDPGLGPYLTIKGRILNVYSNQNVYNTQWNDGIKIWSRFFSGERLKKVKDAVSKKEFAKQVRRAIKENTDPSMTRMIAWQNVIASGVNIKWEAFKRFWHEPTK